MGYLNLTRGSSSFVKSVLALPFLFLVSGCADRSEPPQTVVDMKEDSILSSTASLSHSYIRSETNRHVTCTMPSPDAAFDRDEDDSFSFSLLSFGGEEKGGNTATSSAKEGELSGRTPALLMSRELFFRACEFSSNFNLEKDEAIALYRETLSTVRDAWEIEANNTSVSLGSSLTINEQIDIVGHLSSLNNRENTSQNDRDDASLQDDFEDHIDDFFDD